MLATQLIALAVFIVVFVVATLRNVHIGVLMFATACAVGVGFAGMSLTSVFEGFPIDIMVILVGVTYFFSIAQANGTIDLIISALLKRIGDRPFFLPLAFMAITAGISAMGAPLAGLVMAPVAMPVAKRYGIDRMLMGLAVGTGLSAGAFAPTSLFAIVTYGTAHSSGIPLSPGVLFLIALVANLVLLAVAYVLFGGRKLLGTHREESLLAVAAAPRFGDPAGGTGTLHGGTSHGGTAGAADPDAEPGSGTMRVTTQMVITMLCMVGLIATIIVISLTGNAPHIGVLCFAFSAFLTLVDPQSGRTAVGSIDWSTVLLVGGIITFVGVLQELGVIDLLSSAAGMIGWPVVAAIGVCFLGGLISAFASTTGMLAALVPLAIPLIDSSGLAGWALIASLGVCSSIVDVSPFSGLGATIIASAEEDQRPRMVRLLMRWGLSLTVIGPVVLVLGLVVPASSL